jgi:hypothetical protein
MTVLVPLTGRALKILDRFPSFMRLEKPGKAIGDVSLTLGGDLDHAEGRLARILGSRRIEQASEEGDILKLAALLGLVEEDFFLLRRAHDHGLFDPSHEEALAPPPAPGAPGTLPPVPPSEEELAWAAYDGYLDALRLSVMRTASVMTDGCGTLWALAEGACLLLGAENGGKLTLHHVDTFSLTKGFIHRIKARFRVPVEPGAPDDPDAPAVGGWKKIERLLYIHENPIVDKETELAEARQRQRFPVHRGGFFHGRTDLRVVGFQNRTVKPLVINLTTREGYGYRGVLADGQELTFSRDGHTYLDGEDVTAKCYRIYDGFFDDPAKARFQDADPGEGFAKVDPVGAADRNQPGPAVTGLGELPPPRLPHGDNLLRFNVEEGAFDASRFEEAVFALPTEPDALAALPASGKFQALWREHQAFTVRVLLPPDLKSWEAAFLSGGSLPQHVARGLDRFRPAGVRLEVDFWNDEWVLGESLLEDDSEGTGEGVDFNAPNL